jgi:hypothetical protein
LPPVQLLVGGHDAQVPAVPEQYVLPKAVDAYPTEHVQGDASKPPPAQL